MTHSNSTNSQLLKLALPMLIAGISTPLLGMVDTAVVGHLDEVYYLGAVALGAMIFNFLFWGVGFLRMSSTALTARATGQDAVDEVQLVLFRGLFIAAVLGVLFISAQSLIANFVFGFIESSAQVIHYANVYFDIRIWSAPATLANYVLLGWFLGQGRANLNLYLVVFGNLLNIFLDLIFVIYFQMNVAGVAWATVIAEYFVLFIGLFLAYNKFTLRIDIRIVRQVLMPAVFVKYLKFNRDIFLRTLFLIACFSFFTISSAKYGELVLAANAVLMNLQTFMAYVMDSIAHAVEVLVGKNYFRQKQEKLISIFKVSLFWSVIFALIFSLFYLVFGQWIVSLLTNMEAVVLTALSFMFWMILSPLLSVWSYWFDGVFIGANQAKYMRNTMLFSMLVFFVLFYLLQPYENHGLWAALMGFMFARGVSMAYVFKNKQLMHPRV